MKEEDIDFLISIQDLEQPDFDNACLERENKKLNDIIEKVNKYIVANFTNQDGTIWHSEMQNIYNILNNKDN